MENDKHSGTSTASIMDAVRSHAGAMRPRWHFVLRGMLIVVGVGILLATLLYLVSFAVFSLRSSGALFAPNFGFRGWYIFLRSLPWLLIALSLVFIVVLELLVKHYAFAYRRPLLYSLLGIVVVVFAGGVVVSQTDLHPQLSQFVDQRKVPLAREWYHGYGRPRLKQVHMGEVTALSESGCGMRSIRGENLDVAITKRTRIPSGMRLIIGDHVVVMGERVDDTIQAFGIQKIDELPYWFEPGQPRPIPPLTE